ncbi:hypothetical protein EDD36DRAFT_442651 [Exophiala viscosa]|uniref:Uncharacterized protein n=1 Tax=Exophiala viscosa TaxID=2486360 RepID=A0AAN6IAP4_9EURO|nr:hypothetical protein EDD36DRAFT_442651 [Exophiala viscosa]
MKAVAPAVVQVLISCLVAFSLLRIPGVRYATLDATRKQLILLSSKLEENSALHVDQVDRRSISIVFCLVQLDA